MECNCEKNGGYACTSRYPCLHVKVVLSETLPDIPMTLYLNLWHWRDRAESFYGTHEVKIISSLILTKRGI